MAGKSLLPIVLINDYLKPQGFPSLHYIWQIFKYDDKAQLWPFIPNSPETLLTAPYEWWCSDDPGYSISPHFN